MLLPESPPLTDAADLRFRMATLKAGVWLGLGMIAAGLAYFALTWDDGNRPLLACSGLAVAVTDLGILLLPMERIVAGRWREQFFLTWTLSNVAVLLLLGALDPTDPSPLTLPLMMPMLFAGMSYPRASARICCAAVVFGYGAEALIRGQDFAFSAFFAMVLVWTAGMCLWQARNRERQHVELERQRDELARVSLTDPLTDALNRRGFEDRLRRELADSARSGRPLMLAVLDLDAFKAVNDREGHAAGDALLRETVKRLTGVLRPLDVVGRLGGDEFAVLFPGAGHANAEVLVDRLRDALAGRVPASFGYSCFPADGVHLEELFNHADVRLYAAKAESPRQREDRTLELIWATALADAVDRRMDASHQHSRKVAEYAADIARGLGWDEPQLGTLRLAATLHDVGKVCIPDRILNKPGRLDRAEYTELKRHTIVGAEMLARIDDLDEIVPWVRHSHEHIDGSGYPDGLVGDAIPAASRILLVADAFDAMTSERPYGRARTVAVALAELQRHAGTQFDAACVAALTAAVLASEPASAPASSG
jgi:diguanylate cyclase (GGDEF)-like protein/putative nucleotidyltransferase with HDIG domain